MGRFVRHEGAALEVAETDGSLSVIPFERVMKVELSSGRRSRTLAGTFCGAAVGVGIGAVAGANIRTERWVEVPRTAVRVAGVRGGAAVSFTIRF